MTPEQARRLRGKLKSKKRGEALKKRTQRDREQQEIKYQEELARRLRRELL